MKNRKKMHTLMMKIILNNNILVKLGITDDKKQRKNIIPKEHKKTNNKP